MVIEEKLTNIIEVVRQGPTNHFYDSIVCTNQFDEVKGATDLEIEETENFLGVKLPDKIKALYKFKNGSFSFPLFCFEDADSYTLLTLKEMKENTTETLELASDTYHPSELHDYLNPRTKPYYTSPKWIPFAVNSTDCVLCFDCDPPQGSRYGQIIKLWHDPDYVEYVCAELLELLEISLRNFDGWVEHNQECVALYGEN